MRHLHMGLKSLAFPLGKYLQITKSLFCGRKDGDYAKRRSLPGIPIQIQSLWKPGRADWFKILGNSMERDDYDSTMVIW